MSTETYAQILRDSYTEGDPPEQRRSLTCATFVGPLSNGPSVWTCGKRADSFIKTRTGRKKRG